jgi:hypothetical protein
LATLAEHAALLLAVAAAATALLLHHRRVVPVMAEVPVLPQLLDDKLVPADGRWMVRGQQQQQQHPTLRTA